jgi:hypothetical protein
MKILENKRMISTIVFIRITYIIKDMRIHLININLYKKVIQMLRVIKCLRSQPFRLSSKSSMRFCAEKETEVKEVKEEKEDKESDSEAELSDN